MKNTDTSKVLEYLFEHNSGLTVSEARDKLGTTELRSIVAHAAKRGFIFEKVWEHGEKRDGRPARWIRYFLVGYTEP